MARTGRPRKLPGERVDARRQREAPAIVVPSAPPDAFIIPEPPEHANGDGIGDRALLLWDAFWLSPSARVVELSGVERYVVDDWIRAVDELETIERVIRDARLVQGSTGQPVLNPLHARAQAMRQVIDRCQQKLGLSPQDRARLGIAIGEQAMTAARLNERLRQEAAS